MEEKNKITQLLHTPYEKEDAYHSLAMPIYQTAAYEFDSAEEMEKAFCGLSSEHAYSRITNPTVQYFEKRVQALTGALSVTAMNSGMAAISNICMTVAYAGSNIVTSSHLFGNTYSLFKSTLSAFGVEMRFCDLLSAEAVREAIDENTCAVFLETITNPQLEVADLRLLASIARERNVPLIADTTLVPFHVFHAREFGIDIEIVSSTKYISGGATSLGGLIIDYETFDWSCSPRLSEMAAQVGRSAFTAKLRKEVHRNLGAYMTPQTAYAQTLGLETLEVRYSRQASTCLELAKHVATLTQVCKVSYPGLESSPFYAISQEQFGSFPGAMFTFDLESRQVCFRFMDRLRLIRRATNLFDNKSLAIHPASTIYGNFTEEQRQSMDVSQHTIRISVGLEAVEDLFADICQALR